LRKAKYLSRYLLIFICLYIFIFHVLRILQSLRLFIEGVIKIKLYEHQEEALRQTRGKRRVAYYLDMGLGKTFVGSEKLKELGAAYNLLVCQKSKIADWAEHFKSYYDYEVIVFKDQSIDGIPQNSVIIVNYELLWRRKQLQQLGDFTLILDESQYIKCETAKRTRFILGLEPENVVLLSGTPTGGRYEELWSQLKLLGWDITRELFYKHYVIIEKKELKNRIIYEVKGYKNVYRLKEKLRQYGALFMKTEEVFNLPEQVESVVQVENTAEYIRFFRDGTITIGGETMKGYMSLTRFLHLRELAASYNYHKQEVLEDLLESGNDRFVIFYNFKREFEIIKNICLGLGRPVSFINGEGTDLKSYEEEEDSITLVQYQVGAAGVNLQKACRMIYFSLPLSCELWMQSKKRIHRINQNRTCFYYYLITENSIEGNILEVLRKRQDFTLELFEKL
jgi:SNF2 family DNA or RNA helicase